ncbi:MAG: M23 family metallopeptidase [Pseudomonadales bacterium]|nr:M23 family metallopeptidase [Pseudomonadales bacterium]
MNDSLPTVRILFQSLPRLQVYILCLAVASIATASQATELYKYQDANGRWMFTDRKPADRQDVDTLHYQSPKAEKPQPAFYVYQGDSQYNITVDNPLYAPIRVQLQSSIFSNGVFEASVPAKSKQAIFTQAGKAAAFKYQWLLGDIVRYHDEYLYALPISSKRSHQITQSFNDSFSHFKRPNRYAVDFATKVGTYISAARAGTVIDVVDSYQVGTASQYFLDKANYIQILHSDGTYAVYAHLLLASALVQPGEQVAEGQRIARAGSSGYSTGPHLHFVIRKNNGMETVSVPFQFKNQQGQAFTPERGMQVDGVQRSYSE